MRTDPLHRSAPAQTAHFRLRGSRARRILTLHMAQFGAARRGRRANTPGHGAHLSRARRQRGPRFDSGRFAQPEGVLLSRRWLDGRWQQQVCISPTPSLPPRRTARSAAPEPAPRAAGTATSHSATPTSTTTASPTAGTTPAPRLSTYVGIPDSPGSRLGRRRGPVASRPCRSSHRPARRMSATRRAVARSRQAAPRGHQAGAALDHSATRHN